MEAAAGPIVLVRQGRQGRYKKGLNESGTRSKGEQGHRQWGAGVGRGGGGRRAGERGAVHLLAAEWDCHLHAARQQLIMQAACCTLDMSVCNTAHRPTKMPKLMPVV